MPMRTADVSAVVVTMEKQNGFIQKLHEMGKMVLSEFLI